MTSDRPHKRGTIGMTKVSRESNSTRDLNDTGSQLYICAADNSGLDRTYTVFGEIFRGMDVAEKIVAAPATNSTIR
jgi:peptidyl-prolyl cis-trans isomerase B (cyclophilin B)